MKLTTASAICFSFVLMSATRGKASEVPDLTLMMMQATTLHSLSQTARTADLKRRRDRACQLQRLHRLPPSLCYADVVGRPDAEEKMRQLNADCRLFSTTANRLPLADESTSDDCRAALIERAKDLAYAEKRNASR